MGKGKLRYVFPGGNTAQGFYSFYESGLENLDRIFVLKGGPGTGKSTLMRKIGMSMMDRGDDVEFWQCSSDNDSLDGVIIPDLRVAVVDGTAPHVVDPKYPGAVDEIVNLGAHWNQKYLQAHKGDIIKLTKEYRTCFFSAYKYLEEAKNVHDEWESIHIQGMDFAKADQKAQELREEIFSRGEFQEQIPLVRHMFASAITPKGTVNFIDNITESYRNRYIVKGLPGTGKSTLTKKIVQGAVARGLEVEICHCALDPDSVDVALIPSLKVAVIDGTSPHVIDPERPGDRVVNMLDCLDMEAVEKHTQRLKEIELEFKNLIDEAIKRIAQAKSFHDNLEDFYVQAMDFEAVNETGTRIFNKILVLAVEREN